MLIQSEITQRLVSTYYTLLGQRVIKHKTEFCSPVGLAPCNFTLMEKGKRELSMQLFCSFCNAWKINPAWLVTGDGDQFLKE